MHGSSIWHMQDCVSRHFVGKRLTGRVIEIGSGYGSPGDPPYRKIFTDLGWAYQGLDVVAGPNVDIVAEDPFMWPIANESFDAIISGQMLDHNAMFWLSFLEMGRVLSRGGIMVHIAPSRGYEHRAPSDCWRIYRDGMEAIARWTGLRCIEATTDWSAADSAYLKSKRPKVYDAIPRKGQFAEGGWGDTVGVFVKPDNWRPSTALHYMAAYLRKLNAEADDGRKVQSVSNSTA
jgi:hypothetical protein